jgi:hypothetical protein
MRMVWKGICLRRTPGVHWPTPHGEYYLHGGHRLWAAPENLFYICPEDGVRVVEEKDKVVLRGPIDASGLEKELSFRLDETVHISHIASYGMVTNRLSLHRGALRNYDWAAWRSCPYQLRKDWSQITILYFGFIRKSMINGLNCTTI